MEQVQIDVIDFVCAMFRYKIRFGGRPAILGGGQLIEMANRAMEIQIRAIFAQ